MIARLRGGDTEAFAWIHSVYYDILCRSVSRLLGDRDATEDTVQGLLAELWVKRESITITGSLQSYLLASVRHRALNFLRTNQRFVRDHPEWVPSLERAAGEMIPENMADELFEQTQIRQQLQRALAVLTPQQRRAVVLMYGQGLTQDQVAIRMGISKRSVRTHLRRSIIALRKAIIPLSLLLLSLLLSLPQFVTTL